MQAFVPILSRTGSERGSRSRTSSQRLNLSVQTPAWWDQFVEWEHLTRPDGSHRSNELLRQRYETLPERVKGPSQMLGKVSPGCEGTQGVFPKCTFSCKPCYHSADANHVRIDGIHTAIETARQMEVLDEHRGPHGHCQLIGGEVSLLPPEDHATALAIMKKYGRVPMSFSHGDFTYEYLRDVAVGRNGKRRFDRLDFAVHFDRFMVGRTGIRSPNSEGELNPHRRELLEKFKRLKREHNVDFFVAHNMTVQPGNIGEIASVLEDNLTAGFRLFSFQPAAFQGDNRRWTADYRKVAENDGEDVWKEIEKGVGARLPYKVLQMGDSRCNRQCIGFVVASKTKNRKFVPVLDDEDPEDMKIRNEFTKNFGSFVMPTRLLLIKFLRHVIRRPYYLVLFAMWFGRFLKRAGGVRVLFRGVMFLTIVMHRFMDAENVKAAWDLMELGIDATDPKIRETQERLQACSYGMAQTDQGRVIPACVQHSVYDPLQNKKLREELPLNQTPKPLEKLADNISM
uniref:Uncharacterized protein n=1 Tax=Rhodosorus marinus TaxID=101924 RepID=A0A7S0BLU1_9RHOD|mmetsp:Transcript_21028/g.30572  ORF Transcript_21028/g.30572 Transcript_21028/m.30572 type:complete len:512 (+) Transcript_21028:227-1762(+)|eukprot:CAMPEP_0184737802 /NCGR_PEP_ID=MMETSP0315-20130426/575_1 /TAXON_ID=101924 /ORGANISM="Rhodosorus marinus, Strain UTEX LB 2760" /LENGTH=511 /DNA_ID=CAMNT_0027205201 /DNA_START=162 /DNA_END=1697 /DNA_ORIENTATION=+